MALDQITGTVTIDEVVKEVQEWLQSENLGIWQRLARSFDSAGGRFKYKIPERLRVEDYSGSATPTIQNGHIDEVIIDTDREKVIRFEVHSFDFVTQTMGEAEKDYIVASMQSAFIANMDLAMLATLNTSANVSSVGLEQASTIDEAKIARFGLSKLMATLEGTVDSRVLGIQKSRMVGIYSTLAYTTLVNSYDTNVRENTMEVRFGSMDGMAIGGVMVFKHPFMGKLIPAADGIETADVDLTGMEGIVFVDLAIGHPVNRVEMTPRINERGNTEIISKWKYGTGLIRPELVVKLDKTVVPFVDTSADEA